MTTSNNSLKEAQTKNKIPESGCKPAQTIDPDETVLQYATAYERERVISGGEDAWLLLAQQLEGYRRFLHHEGAVPPAKETWTPLQRLIYDASIFAGHYVDQLSRDESIDCLIKDMNEDGRHLPYGIAEWIVDEVAKASQSDNKDESG